MATSIDRWQRGGSMHQIAASFGRYHSSIQRIIYTTGGFRPKLRARSPLSLTLTEQETISRGIASEAFARELDRAPSTLCREINRNGGYDDYRATGKTKNRLNTVSLRFSPVTWVLSCRLIVRSGGD